MLEIRLDIIRYLQTVKEARQEHEFSIKELLNL